MKTYLQWNCDFCRKACIVMNRNGLLYCDNCKMSYGENNIVFRFMMESEKDEKV